MLYIVRKNGQEFTWHIGNTRPMQKYPSKICGGIPIPQDPTPFNDVIEVQADGEELAFIRRNFDNLIWHNKKSVLTWRGDLSQFIYDHI